MIKQFLKITASVILASFVGCKEKTGSSGNEEGPDRLETESFSMRNSEIRQDIVSELLAKDIEHWENKDGTIGFYSRDAEKVDAIGFAAIGAYAARN